MTAAARDEFAAILRGLGVAAVEPAAEPEPEQTGPRLPAPNAAQGTSSEHPEFVDPVDAVSQALRGAFSRGRANPGGWANPHL